MAWMESSIWATDGLCGIRRIKRLELNFYISSRNFFLLLYFTFHMTRL